MIDRRIRGVALLVAACYFMEFLDGTIVTTATPQIASSLGVGVGSVSLVITAYLVTLAVVIPISGWMAARWGARPVFLAAIVIFTVASALCAASQSLPMLVAMRVLQGVGGAMMVPVGRLVVLARTDRTDLMKVMSYLVWPALIAPVFAPLAGGLIVTYTSWHWLFLVNVPLGVVAFAFALRLVDSPPQPSPPPLDRVGVLLTCTGLAGLTLTAHMTTGPDWMLALALAALSLALLLAAARHLLAARFPLINLQTLRIATFGASVAGSFPFWLVVGAIPFLLPLLFQEVFDWSPVKSGTVVLFVFVGNIAIKPATTYIYGRFGFRPVLIAATIGIAASMLAVALLSRETPLVVIVAVAAVSGAFRSLGLTGYTTLAFSDVPDAQMRDANTVQAIVQQLSLGLGVAVAAVALRLGQPLGELFGGSGSEPTAYAIAFVILAVLTLPATVSALRLHASAGDALRRTRQVRGA